MMEKADIRKKIKEIPEKIRTQHPLVHMIPNNVTVALCTDGISALGARPLMAVAPEEMGEIPSYADAVVVNMGQPTKEKLTAAKTALICAQEHQVPLVWDPVGAGASEFRKTEFQKLYALPWQGIIKGNQAEASLFQSGVLSHQGIDSIGEFALETKTTPGRTWAVTGAKDLVFDDMECFRIDHTGESKLLLTGSGCLTGAVMGCCYAVEKDQKAAAVAALLMMSYAAVQASKLSGYGSQKTALLDALTGIDTAHFADYLEEIAGRIS